MAEHDSWYQLPPDYNAWQTTIISNLARKIPEIPRYIAGIDLPKIDPVLGDADGLVYLLEGIAAIPITIRNCKLAPLDVMVTKKDEFYPVTEVFLQKIYADNVLGTPQNPPSAVADIDEEGPARRVINIPTIDNGAKYASQKPEKYATVKNAPNSVRKALREKIASSNALLTFFNTHSPEFFSVLSPSNDKVASEETTKIASDDVPELHFLHNDQGRYFFNGEQITVKKAGEFSKTAGLSTEDLVNLAQGGYVCLDYREKHAALIPLDVPEQSFKDEDEKLMPDRDGNYVATVLDRAGVPHRGFVFRQTQETERNQYFSNLFVGSSFHSIQEDMMILDKTPVSIKEVMGSCQPTPPQANMYGLLINEFRIIGPVRLASVEKFGTMAFAKVIFNGLDDQDGYAIGRDVLFYQIPEEREAVLKNKEELMLSTQGENFTAKLGYGGEFVIGDKSMSYGNALYSLMDAHGLTMDDSLHVLDQVKTAGISNFKLAADKEESKESKGDKKNDSSKDKSKDSTSKPGGGSNETKQPKKDTNAKPPKDQSGQGQPSVQGNPAEGAQQEVADPNAQFSVNPNSELNPNQQVMDQQNGISPDGTESGPVDFNDMEDIAKINDPQLMDNYLSGTLAEANVAGREEMMQISDDVVEAIKSLGKLLFRIRLGQIDYVKETDAQMALNKMSDIAKAIGLSSTQITDPMDTRNNQQLPEQQSGLAQTSSSVY